MNSLVCVDANVILRSLVPAPFSETAEALLTRWQQDGTTLIAPSVLAFEVISSLCRLVYLDELTREEGEEAFEKFLKLNIRLSQRRAIFPLAWRLAKEFNQPRAYDAAYLALAYLAGCQLWTADERLYHRVKDRLEWVKWLGNLSVA